MLGISQGLVVSPGWGEGKIPSRTWQASLMGNRRLALDCLQHFGNSYAVMRILLFLRQIDLAILKLEITTLLLQVKK